MRGNCSPLNLIYSTKEPSYGEYKDGDATLYVSSGAGDWSMPLRTEIGCQYEIITLSPAA